jgi:hypothetical protein
MLLAIKLGSMRRCAVLTLRQPLSSNQVVKELHGKRNDRFRACNGIRMAGALRTVRKAIARFDYERR